MTTLRGFTGTYRAEDCWFLLKEIPTSCIDDQERELASGGTGVAHYRQKLLREEAPDPVFFDIYDAAMRSYKQRLAKEVARLARAIANRSCGKPMVLASLCRAGTPYGVLLGRALRYMGWKDTAHYSISLIHKHGVDHNALDAIRKQHPDCAFWFVDGWTGKGGISRELDRSVREYNASRGTNLPTKLAVIADLAGMSLLASTTDDYMVPSAPIDAPLNGLVSRTIVGHPTLEPSDFHGGMLYWHLTDCDRSNQFVDAIDELVPAWLSKENGLNGLVTDELREAASRRSRETLASMMAQAGVTDPDLVKNGMCEAVRAVKRRPMRSFHLRHVDHPRNDAIKAMCRARGIEIVSAPDSAYECVAVCQS